MYRAPTCCTARATRSSPPRCWSKPSFVREQTRRGVSIKHWEEFEDVADHCTVCHKCYNALPGEDRLWRRPMNMRNLLRKMGRRAGAPATAAMFFLNATNPTPSNWCAAGDWPGLQGPAPGQQRRCTGGRRQTGQTCGHRGHGAGQRAGDPLHQQEDARRPAQEDRRALLWTSRTGLRPHHPRTRQHHAARQEAVFYFPGCGSERCSARWGWPRRPCCGTPACKPCCHRATCAAATRNAAMA